ncbi:unnamed protein product, partial [Ectocarpus sp. 4 AP-2014]
ICTARLLHNQEVAKAKGRVTLEISRRQKALPTCVRSGFDSTLLPSYPFTLSAVEQSIFSRSNRANVSLLDCGAIDLSTIDRANVSSPPLLPLRLCLVHVSLLTLGPGQVRTAMVPSVLPILSTPLRDLSIPRSSPFRFVPIQPVPRCPTPLCTMSTPTHSVSFYVFILVHPIPPHFHSIHPFPSHFPQPSNSIKIHPVPPRSIPFRPSRSSLSWKPT